jgi:hypothetical protein
MYTSRYTLLIESKEAFRLIKRPALCGWIGTLLASNAIHGSLFQPAIAQLFSKSLQQSPKNSV